MDTKNTNLEETKSEIEARVANFKQIAPYTTYKEKEQLCILILKRYFQKRMMSVLSAY